MLHLLNEACGPRTRALLPHGLILVAVGVAVAVLTRVLGSPGDVELLVDNIHISGGAEDLRQLPSLFPISFLCIAAGGGLGPEAPLVQTTGTVGSSAARRFGLDPIERAHRHHHRDGGRLHRVVRRAPWLRRLRARDPTRRGMEYYEALMPAVLGSLAGYAIYVLITGVGLDPSGSSPPSGPVQGGDLAWAVACGASARSSPPRSPTRANSSAPCSAKSRHRRAPPIGGLALALLAWMSPFALTFGEAQLDYVTTTDLAWRTLALAVVAKMLASSVTLASGWKGGFIIPLFFMGACLGACRAHRLSQHERSRADQPRS